MNNPYTTVFSRPFNAREFENVSKILQLKLNTTEYFYSSDMYVDCADYSSQSQEAEGSSYCWNFISIGGVLALITLPITTSGLMGNAMLLSCFLASLKRIANHNIFIVLFTIVDTLNLIQNNLMHDFFGKGLPWLGFKGIYATYYSVSRCKFFTFFGVFIDAWLANLIFSECIHRLMVIKLKGSFSISNSYMYYIMFCITVVSFIQAGPVAVVYNIWRIDSRYDCAAKPRFPRTVVVWVEVHRILFCDGLFQISLVILINIYIWCYFWKLCATISHIYATIKDLQLNSEILNELVKSLKINRNDTFCVLVHTSVTALILFAKSVCAVLQFRELYIFSDDNTSVMGVLKLYYYRIMYALFGCFYSSFSSSNFWLYYFGMAGFRKWLKRRLIKVAGNSDRVHKIANMLMIGDHLDQRFRVENLKYENPVLYERLKLLEKNNINRRMRIVRSQNLQTTSHRMLPFKIRREEM